MKNALEREILWLTSDLWSITINAAIVTFFGAAATSRVAVLILLSLFGSWRSCSSGEWFGRRGLAAVIVMLVFTDRSLAWLLSRSLNHFVLAWLDIYAIEVTINRVSILWPFIIHLQINLSTIVGIKGCITLVTAQGRRFVIDTSLLLWCTHTGLTVKSLASLAWGAALRWLLTGGEKAETFEDVRRDLEGVEFGLQVLRIDFETLLLCFLNILKHAKCQLSLNFLGAAGIQPSIKCNNGTIFHQRELNDKFESNWANFVSCNIDTLDILVVAESFLQTLGKVITKLVSGQNYPS